MSANLTHLDIFSGIGGFALAAQEAGFRTVAFCESSARCRAFLEKRWGLPVEPDIRKFDAKVYRGISLLTGGPPCQPASRAGKQGGEGDDRWLWPEALRVLEEAKPSAVVFENPPGILDVGCDGILSEMGRQGYEVQSFDIPACAVDSPQLRHRIWIVGFLLGDTECYGRNTQREDNRGDDRRELVSTGESGLAYAEQQGREPASQLDGEPVESDQPTSRRPDVNGCNLSVAASRCKRSGQVEQERRSEGRAIDRRDSAHELSDTERERRERCTTESREAESRVSLGSASRLHWQNSIWVPCADGKLRRAPDDSFMLVDGLHRSVLGALGNSIVPQVAYEILKAVRQVI